MLVALGILELLRQAKINGEERVSLLKPTPIRRLSGLMSRLRASWRDGNYGRRPGRRGGGYLERENLRPQKEGNRYEQHPACREASTVYLSSQMAGDVSNPELLAPAGPAGGRLGFVLNLGGWGRSWRLAWKRPLWPRRWADGLTFVIVSQCKAEATALQGSCWTNQPFYHRRGQSMSAVTGPIHAALNTASGVPESRRTAFYPSPLCLGFAYPMCY